MSSDIFRIPDGITSMRIKISNADKVIPWIMKHSFKSKYVIFLKDDIRYALFFKTTKIKVNKYIKSGVRIEKGDEHFILSKQDFNEIVNERSKLWFTEDLTTISGNKVMVNRFVSLMNKMFGEDAITEAKDEEDK